MTMISYIDTNEVEEISKELLLATDELSTELDELFERLENVPDVTKEWVGYQAYYYFSCVASDREIYTRFVEKLREVGRELNTIATDSETYIKANNTAN